MRPPVAMNTPPPKASGKPAAVAVGSLSSRPARCPLPSCPASGRPVPPCLPLCKACGRAVPRIGTALPRSQARLSAWRDVPGLSFDHQASQIAEYA